MATERPTSIGGNVPTPPPVQAIEILIGHCLGGGVDVQDGQVLRVPEDVSQEAAALKIQKGVARAVPRLVDAVVDVVEKVVEKIVDLVDGPDDEDGDEMEDLPLAHPEAGATEEIVHRDPRPKPKRGGRSTPRSSTK